MPRGDQVTIERSIRILAGSLVLLSLALGVRESPAFVSPKFLWLTAFVGANLLQSALTGFCPAEIILRKLGVRAQDGKTAPRVS
jgi:Protein of unknown function (DUF2892)